MRFEFLKLTASNFALYANFEIDFRELENSLVFIEGENRDVSGLDSNGAGKTLIGDLIADLLFDKTIRRHAVKSLVGKFVKGSVAELTIEDSVSKEVYTIKKYRSHPDFGDALFFDRVTSTGTRVSLGKKTKADTYKEIWKTFGINWRSFKNRNYFGQDDPERFLRVTDAAKAKIMVDMQGLHDLQKAKEISRKQKRDLFKKETRLDRDIKSYERSNEDLEESLRVAIAERRKQINDGLVKRDKISHEIEEITSSLEDVGIIKNEIDKVKGEIEEGRKNKEAYLEKVRELDVFEKDRVFLVKTIASETENIDGLMRKISQAKKKISDLKKRLITVCDKCGAELTEKRTKASIISVKAEGKRVVSELRKSKSNKECSEKTLSDLGEQISEMKEQKTKLFSGLSKYDKLFDVFEELKSQEAEELEKRSKIEALVRLREDLEKPPKKISSAELSLKKNLVSSKKQLSALKKSLKKTRKEMEKNEFSEKTFERSMRIIFNSFLDSLNHHANVFLDILCDNDIDVSFEPKTKKGSKELVDEVQVLVSVDGATPRDFRTYSGGEKARVDLAVQLTLFSSSVSPFPFLFLDEPFTGVDLSGRTRVLSLLQEISEEGNVVFVVSNKNIPVGYGSTLKVIREGGKSRIESYA